MFRCVSLAVASGLMPSRMTTTVATFSIVWALNATTYYSLLPVSVNNIRCTVGYSTVRLCKRESEGMQVVEHRS